MTESIISNVKIFSVMFYFHRLPRNVKKKLFLRTCKYFWIWIRPLNLYSNALLRPQPQKTSPSSWPLLPPSHSWDSIKQVLSMAFREVNLPAGMPKSICRKEKEGNATFRPRTSGNLPCLILKFLLHIQITSARCLERIHQVDSHGMLSFDHDLVISLITLNGPFFYLFF